MTRTLMTGFVVSLVLLVGISAHAVHDTMTDGTKILDPGADAARLYTHITRPTPYNKTWSLMPGEKEMQQSRDPHGSFVTCYVNDKALKSIEKKRGMANGSIIISENYGADKRLESITVMYKIDGFNPGAGDWFWAKYGPNNGYVLASGKADECIACHSSQKANDYIHTLPVRS